MRLLAIDPGPVESAWVTYDTVTRHPVAWAKEPNDHIREQIIDDDYGSDMFAVEMIASYGMPVVADVFETCVVFG